MSVLIKGMKMPTSGRILIVFPSGRALEVSADATQKIFRETKAVPVPPHGRLIDAGAFIAEQRHLYCENCERRKGMKNGKAKFVYDIGDAPCRACGYGDVLDDLEDAPTVIEAEDGGYSEQELQNDYEKSVEMAEYCERYEPTYDLETGAM